MDAYKVGVIKKMIEAEESSNGGYGAHLSMDWQASIAPINLDSGALRLLLKYYESKEEAAEWKSTPI